MLYYYVFYKPFQVLCQFTPEKDKLTLADFLSTFPKDVYPVGRLDYDSEGLLILTNDKDLNHRLLNPINSHRRTYLVQVEGTITDKSIQKLSEGVIITIDGKPYLTQKAKAQLMEEPENIPDRNPPIRYRKNIPTSWLSLSLTEGKNRQVRKMTAAVGFPTLRLIRNAIGHLTIKDLKPGNFKQLSKDEIKALLLS